MSEHTQKIRAALEWYADKALLSEQEPDISGSGISSIRQDGGRRAYNALDELDALNRLSGRVTVTDAMVSAAMPAYNLTGPEYHIAPRTSEEHVRFILQAGFAALDTAPTPSPDQIRKEALREDPFFELVVDGIAEADKAMRKFPQPNYVISKVAEEAGEVVKAAIHHAEGRETAENVKAEMRQLIAMLFRLYIEGDQIHGMAPLITGGDDDAG